MNPRIFIRACTLMIAAIALQVCAAGIARAQETQCSKFLHMRDGSWRSFDQADIVGPRGVIHIETGQILRPSAHSATGEIARILNDVCSP